MRRLLLLVLASGCTGELDTQTPETDAAANPASDAVARAMQWVDAKMPYCQAPNHHEDLDAECPSTCTRPDNTAWDAYRSDCSGLVSWAWGLPAPGRITTTFAPFDLHVSHEIAASELQPGDAINNDHHMMLFEKWIVPGTKATFIEESGCSTSNRFAHETTAAVTLDGNTITLEYRGKYAAIREN
jgi:hypothetical protein